MHPRVHRAEWARARFGALAERSFAALERCDPPADALVEALASAHGHGFDLEAQWQAHVRGEPVLDAARSLFDAVAEVPDWVDWAAIAEAPALFERGGMFGGLVLSLRSLMGGYTAPAGNKPLMFTGQLRKHAPRRVAETVRFVTAVCAPDGMRQGQPGWLISLRVRLMHAQVRRLLWASGRWDRERWAEPINQHDMLATMLLFSEVYVEGLRLFGFDVSSREAECWIALWRYVAWVMGTEAELLPRDFAEAQALTELIGETQGPPDEDSRALAAALLAPPESLIAEATLPARTLFRARARIAHGLCRMLIGDVVADQLGVDQAPVLSTLLPAVPKTIATVEQVRQVVPAIVESQRELGRRYWTWVEEVSLGGRPARFARPQGLAG